MDTVHWPQPQEIGLVKPMEEVVVPIGTVSSSSSTRGQERRVRPQKEQALNCPRCNSTNTKFCYYNNYSLTQPRYFCKTCRRYWTEGGSLRNVPVGGGSRKNKRSSSSSTIASSSLNLNTQNPNKCPEFNEFPILDHTSNPSSTSALELLRSGMMLGPVLEPGSVYPPGFGLQEFRPPHTLFPLDHGAMQGVQESSAGRLLFPFEDLRQVPSSGSAAADHDFEQNAGQGEHPPGFWNQIMGSGGSW